MTALQLVYQHWFVICVLLTASAVPLFCVASALRGLVVTLRAGK